MDKDNIVIRKILRKDNSRLVNLIKEIFEEHSAPKEGTIYSDPTTIDLFKLFMKDRSVLWIAEDNKEILGCCGIYPTEGLEKDCAELVKFYLAAKSRGKGLGKLLMLQSIESAEEMGYTKLYLESLPEFSKAVSMYKKFGFEKLNNRLGSSGHSSCNIWMLKEL